MSTYQPTKNLFTARLVGTLTTAYHVYFPLAEALLLPLRVIHMHALYVVKILVSSFKERLDICCWVRG